MVSKDKYKRRLIDANIEKKMQSFGAVQIDGPKWCGKTTTATHHTKSQISLADPENNYSNRALAQMGPALVLEGEKPHLVDEWQEVPSVKDAVRFACDASEDNGLFILTGSSVPPSESTSHSGAGRISLIRMLTMSLYETGDSSGAVSLYSLIDNGSVPATSVKAIDATELTRLLVRGGWPKAINMDAETAKDLPLDYIRATLDTDIYKLGGVKNKRNRKKVEAIIEALARFESDSNASGSCIEYIQERDLSVTRATLISYYDSLSRLYLLEDQPAFTPPVISNLARNVTKYPKHRFTDPSLIIAALKIPPNMLFKDMSTLERTFDNLCVHDLRCYAEALGASIYHYRDSYGVSADAIVQLDDGRWAAFRNVVSDYDIDKAAAELLKVKSVFDSIDYSPSALCIITAMTKAAYTRPDGVCVVPITALKP